MAGFFFGRQLEQARLEALAREPVAVIYGLPGIGKSELAYRAVATLTSQPAWANVPVTRVIIEPHTVGVLVGYLMGLLAGRGGNVHELVDLLAREPHIIVIDDAHVAPTEVAGLVDELERRPRPASRLVVTSRAELPTATTPVVIKLGPLDADAARALAEHLAGRLGVKADNLGELVEQSGGSPFALRYLVAGRRRGTAGADPIREAIAVLDSETRRSLIQLAAVSGCSRSRIAAARLVPDDRVFDTLTEQFLVESDPERLVVHELVRDAVLSGADPAVVASSRRTAAQVLWDDYELHASPVVAVESICLSASAGDLEQAFARLLVAIRKIASAGLDHLVVSVLERVAAAGRPEANLALTRIFLRMGRIDDASAALERLPATTKSLSFLLARATIAERRCQLDAARDDLVAAVELATSGRIRMLIQARLAIVHTLAGREQEAAPLAALIDAAEPPVSDVDRIRIAWMHGIRHALHLAWNECKQVVAEARRIAQRTGEVDFDFLFMLLELMAASELGDVEHSARLATELESARPSSNLRGRMSELYLGVAQLACGEIARAVSTLGRAFREYERQHDVLLAALAGHYLGRALAIHGDLGPAIEVLGKVAQRARDAGCEALVAPGDAYLARALGTIGRVAESVAIGKRLCEDNRPAMAAEGHAMVAYGHAFEGDIEGARDAIALALETIGDREPSRTDLVLDQAHVELMGGDPERARAGAASVLDDESRRRRPYARGRALFVSAVADIAAGLTDVALSELAEADELALKHGMHMLRARTAMLRSATSHQGASVLDRVPAEQQRGYRGILRILGLRPETIIVTTRRGRIHAEPAALKTIACHHDLVVDAGSGTIYGRSGGAVEGRGVAASILVALADAVEPVSAERLYQIVWGGNDYHPLRHRNTLYIALNRTRKLLETLVGEREVIGREGAGWIIAPEIDVAVARRDPRVSTVSGQRMA